MSGAQESSVEALMAGIAEGHEAALVELFDRFAPRLLGLVSRLVSDRRAAAAVVEETFIRLWAEAPRYPRDEASIAAWLVLVGRHLAIERRRPSRTPGQHELLLNSYSWLPRPEEIARLEERRELLQKVVNQLPKPQRAALELVVFEGLSVEEIGVKLSEPLGRVKSSLRAGMRFLRHRLRAVLGTWSANI